MSKPIKFEIRANDDVLIPFEITTDNDIFNVEESLEALKYEAQMFSDECLNKAEITGIYGSGHLERTIRRMIIDDKHFHVLYMVYRATFVTLSSEEGRNGVKQMLSSCTEYSGKIVITLIKNL